MGIDESHCIMKCLDLTSTIIYLSYFFNTILQQELIKYIERFY